MLEEMVDCEMLLQDFHLKRKVKVLGLRKCLKMDLETNNLI